MQGTIAAGAEQQITFIYKTTAGIEERSDFIHQMTDSAQNAVGIAEQTAAAAGDGNQAVASAVQQMKVIEEAVTHSEQVVDQVG